MKKGENSPGSAASRYWLGSVGRACLLLKGFADDTETLSLADIVERTGLEKTIAFRLVYTLEAEGFLRKAGPHRYSRNIKLLSTKPFRIGYAAEGAESLFSIAVSEGVQWAAARNEVELIFLDNRYSPKAALRNAERFIDERVDLVIDFQGHAKVAGEVSALFRKAAIPLIAVGVPHPGAVFYGVDNYRAGLLAGRALAEWAKRNWQAKADRMLLLGAEVCGPLPKLRLTGAEAFVRKAMPGLSDFQYIDSRGEFLPAFEVVRKHLRLGPARKTLLAGVNDETALGGVRAFEDSGRGEFCAAVALGGVRQARAELRAPGTHLIACIAFFPESYGESLIRLALEILRKKRVPLAVHVKPQMITAQNVNHFYPAESEETNWSVDT